MPNTVLFESPEQRNILLEDFSSESVLAVQANQHLIIRGNQAAILDPGGHKVYNKVLSETMALVGAGQLRYLLLSHQDPDIVAAVNGWLMTTDAVAYVPSLWTRFVPHFGLDRLVMERLKPIPDEGMRLPLADTELWILPAHFLHSPGNVQIYDPVAKILYTGDVGASVGADYVEVTDFAAHLPFIEGFHRRYMAGNAATRLWADMVRGLDVEIIAPQHGAVFKGKELVGRFVDWLGSLECGVDLLTDGYKVPT